MPIFKDGDSPVVPSPVVVDMPGIEVWRSQLAPGGTPTTDPTFGAWAQQPLLKVQSIFHGSSITGMSYAKLSLAAGRPVESADTRVEDEGVMSAGDRIAIVLNESGVRRVLFAGYHTQAQINIDANDESLLFHVAGPEWLWGDHAGSGAQNPIFGQIRRKSAGDDAYASAGGSVITAFANMGTFSVDAAVFNVDGRKNMSASDVNLNSAGDQGRAFEIPNRYIGATAKAEAWTLYQAVRTLIFYYNDPATSGIVMPDMDADTILDRARPLPQTDVDGMGLWAALSRLLHPDYGFTVIPKLTAVTGSTWTGFSIKFFKRSDGAAADVRINPLGTLVTGAAASVARLEAVKDLSKTVSAVTIRGRSLKLVRLQYFGDGTSSAAPSPEVGPIVMQHGWTPGVEDLATFADDRIEPGATIAHKVIDLGSVNGKASADSVKWKKRYCTNGTEFTKYQHVFRLFVWNEAGEWLPTGTSDLPRYGATSADDFDYVVPDLTKIAGVAAVGATPAIPYVRRRRPFLETPYRLNGSDDWQKMPPTLYVAAIADTTTDQSPWRRIETTKYRIDPERGALWITAPDLAQWCPLIDITQQDQDDTVDGRTFATLLYTGKLRMLIECCVENDSGFKVNANRQASAGTPFQRFAVKREDRVFYKVTEYTDDGVGTPSGVTGAVLPDDTTAATNLAQSLRNGMEEQQVHASVLVEADWPGQPIGSFITSTGGGRAVNLRGGASSPGAQIVARRFDLVAMKWELLTESVALQLRDVDRLAIVRKRRLLTQQRAGAVAATPGGGGGGR